MVKIRVSYEKPEELEQVLSLLESGGNVPEKVRIPEKRAGKHYRAYLELHPGKVSKN